MNDHQNDDQHELDGDEPTGQFSSAVALLGRAAGHVREHGLHTVPVDRALYQVLRYAGFLQLDAEVAAERRAAGGVATVTRYEVDADELPQEVAGKIATAVAEEDGRWASPEFLVRASIIALARALVGSDDAEPVAEIERPADLLSPVPVLRGRAVAGHVDAGSDPAFAAAAAYGFVLAQPRPSADAAREEWQRRLRFVGEYHQLMSEVAVGRARARTLAGAWMLFNGRRSLFEDPVLDVDAVPEGSGGGGPAGLGPDETP